MPLGEAMAVLEKKFNDQNWVKENGYYAIGMRENFLQDWQIGWTGGMISTLPLFSEGNLETKHGERTYTVTCRGHHWTKFCDLKLNVLKDHSIHCGLLVSHNFY